MADRKPKDEAKAYRARALREIKFKSLVIPAGTVFGTDQIPFDPEAMELVE